MKKRFIKEINKTYENLKIYKFFIKKKLLFLSTEKLIGLKFEISQFQE